MPTTKIEKANHNSTHETHLRCGYLFQYVGTFPNCRTAVCKNSLIRATFFTATLMWPEAYIYFPCKANIYTFGRKTIQMYFCVDDFNKIVC